MQRPSLTEYDDDDYSDAFSLTELFKQKRPDEDTRKTSPKKPPKAAGPGFLSTSKGMTILFVAVFILIATAATVGGVVSAKMRGSSHKNNSSKSLASDASTVDDSSTDKSVLTTPTTSAPTDEPSAEATEALDSKTPSDTSTTSTSEDTEDADISTTSVPTFPSVSTQNTDTPTFQPTSVPTVQTKVLPPTSFPTSLSPTATPTAAPQPKTMRPTTTPCFSAASTYLYNTLCDELYGCGATDQNAYLNSEVRQLEDMDLSERILFTDLELQTTEGTCRNQQSGTLQMKSTIQGATSTNQQSSVLLEGTVDALDTMTCEMEYDWSYGFLFDGSGTATVSVATTNLITEWQLVAGANPDDAIASSCSVSVATTSSVNFRGTFANQVLSSIDTLDTMIRNNLESQLRKMLCKEMKQLGRSALRESQKNSC